VTVARGTGLVLRALVPTTSTVAIISPHLDDGVLSCGDLLMERPGSVVVTAFAGRPLVYPPLTSWDQRAGFASGADVVTARRQEDERALTILGARPRWLDFPDPQYGSKPTRRELADALAVALGEAAADAVAMPLGLFHDDHVLTSDAALDVLRDRPSSVWLLYADAIYRPLPDLRDRRLQTILGSGFLLHEVRAPGSVASDQKRRAVACYTSQVRALERSWDGGVSDAFETERYWQVTLSNVQGRSTGRRINEGQDDDRS
jgi:LmbE family N-acetylglucosaminyl deacetylase